MSKAEVKEALDKGQSFFFGSNDKTMEEAQETISALAELLNEKTDGELIKREIAFIEAANKAMADGTDTWE